MKKKDNKYIYIVAFIASLSGLLLGLEIGADNIVLMMDAFRIYFGFINGNGNTTNSNTIETINTNGNEMNNSVIKTTTTTTSTSTTTSEIKTEYDNIFNNLFSIDEGFFHEKIVNYVFTISALFGVLIASFFCEKFGRQKCIMISAYIFTLGILVQGLSIPSWIMITAGRFITGVSAGISSFVTPIYIAELAPANIRGRLSSYYYFMTSAGYIISTSICSLSWFYSNKNSNPKDMDDNSSLLNNLEWRFAFLFQAIPGLTIAILMHYLPESPRWLCLKSHDNEAGKILSKISEVRMSSTFIQNQIRDIQVDVMSRSSGFGELFTPLIRRRTFIIILLQSFQQWIGYIAINYIKIQVLQTMGFNGIMLNIIIPLINGVINFISVFPGMWTIDKLGRKKLLTLGAFFMMIFHLSTWYTLKNSGESKLFQYLVIISIVLFIISYNATWGIVPIIYQAEVFPLRVRIKGSFIGTFSFYLNNWILSILFPMFIMKYGNNILLVFPGICVLAYLFSKIFVIESKGISIEKMDTEIHGKEANYTMV